MAIAGASMNVLAVDIGGTHVKFRTQRHAEAVKVKSGKKMTPEKMMAAIKTKALDWKYDHVSVGYPGPVIHDTPLADPFNLGKGWVKFDYKKAFGNKPLRIMNDAAMQALGSYKGGRMLFLGLGTGLGSALVVDGLVQPMELAHLPWKKGKTYEDFLGEAALKRDGRRKWLKNVDDAIAELKQVLQSGYVVLGGGNAKRLKKLPNKVFLGTNDNAFKGAFLVWKKQHHASG
jgi:polyphosphate glucokinase